MDLNHIIANLSKNSAIFEQLLSGLTEAEFMWKDKTDRWCLLEICCHLSDEEKEDFRARILHVLETPESEMPSIDPPSWVKNRKYIEQNFAEVLLEFLKERKESIALLQSLESADWNNAYQHPKFGAMTAKMFLCNWLAHDYLHIKQILKIKFDYLKKTADEDLSYAGDWV